MGINRKSLIFSKLKDQGAVSVTELCKELNVSDMTIRRDLDGMERDGVLRRIHGGAIFDTGRSFERPYLMRANQDVQAKKQIGCKAAELIVDGDSIALDVGTTTLEVARCLGEKRNITVVTASLPIANEITLTYHLESQIRLILTGGVVRAGELGMIGHFTENMYEQLHVDKAFIGVAGIDLQEGMTEYNLDDAVIKRAIIASAKQKIVVADASKFNQTTFASIGPLEAIDTIITSADAPTDILKKIRLMGIEVIVVG
jgi:DeoR/GlpR family transcriptional regulator of sugar metabolism